jgi:hypothetical protein
VRVARITGTSAESLPVIVEGMINDSKIFNA